MKLLNKEEQAQIKGQGVGGLCSSVYCDIEELNSRPTPVISPKDVWDPLLPGPTPIKPREKVEKY